MLFGDHTSHAYIFHAHTLYYICIYIYIHTLVPHIEGLASDDQELSELHLRNVRSECILKGEPVRRAKVVAVHNDVNHRVQRDREIAVPTLVEVTKKGHYNCDGAVVVHVKEGHLSIRVSKHKDKSINKLVEFLIIEEHKPGIVQ